MGRKPKHTGLASGEMSPSFAVNETAITSTANAIAELHRAAGLRFAVEVGRIVVERIYRGDLSKLRSKGPKDAPLRKLASHPALPLSASALYQAIGVYEVVERLGGLESCGSLGPSHIRAVLPVAQELQENLLRRAQKHGWTVLQLTEQARRKRRCASRGGRPSLPAFVKSIRAIRKYVDEPDVWFGDIERVAELSEQQRHELRNVAEAMRIRCEEFITELERRKNK